MGKRSRPRRRGIQQGVQKHKIKIDPVGSNGIFQLVETLLPRSYIKTIHKFAEKGFNFYAQSCCTLALVPLDIDRKGEFLPASRSKNIANSIILAFNVMLMLHKLYVSIHRALVEEVMDVSTFMCVSTFLCYLVALSTTASSIFAQEETISLLNGMQAALKMNSDHDGPPYRTFENTKTAIVVTSLTILAQAIALFVSLFSVVMKALPVGIFTMVETLGVVPVKTGVARLVWKLLFWPLELALLVPSMLLAGWSAMILMVIAPTLQTCLQQLRKIPVDSVESRVELWRKFLALQVFNRSCRYWVKIMIVPTIFSASCTIIVCLYVTLRHTEIPTYVYLIFPYVGVSLLGLIFWLSYEVTMLIRSADAIVGTLNSTDEDYFRDLPKPQKLYLMKLGKATRSFSYPIGDFMDFSLDVPAGIWDEILNQLLFLLTF